MHRSHSWVATNKKTLPVACHSSEFRGFEKNPNCPNWACGFLQSVFFPLDISSSSGLCVPCCSPPLLPSVSPLLPTATPAVGTGVEGVGWVTSVSTKERFTRLATQRNRLLWKADSSPPRHFPTLPFVRVLFLLVSEVPGTQTPLPHLWGICLPTELHKLEHSSFLPTLPLHTHILRSLFDRGGCYWI